MRPLHPLPPPPPPDAPVPSSVKPAQTSKRKLQALEPPKRARRVVIDPPRWGAVHFTGELLEAGAVVLPEREVGAAAREAPAEKVKTKKRKEREESELGSDVGHAEPAPRRPTAFPAKRTKTPPVTEEPLLASFVAETHAGLGLLKQMFGEGLDRADEWAEVDSEVEELEGGREGGRWWRRTRWKRKRKRKRKKRRIMRWCLSSSCGGKSTRKTELRAKRRR
ncbi:hypothetical protein CALVIDRAFT_290740 [Calocera viscosa TUFC12733]|uniref:Uncharacterized protein n=1 Tax=Calocera viscosa (strain TUFC12733) TaxID=1330018 RepID=A0A167IS38_CALVF|nr:hypothetical protein CALVIDRAFT_290740 [Calocera viscosa TUFC12733]